MIPVLVAISLIFTLYLPSGVHRDRSIQSNTEGKCMSTNDDIIDKLIDQAENVYPDDKMMQQVVVTQAILESRLLNGGSTLAMKYNNLFGIKGRGDKGSITLMTTEYEDGEPIRVEDDFAYNSSWTKSFEQHKNLLDKDRYQRVRDSKDVKQAFINLKICGYATDPNYPKLLTSIWKEHVADYF